MLCSYFALATLVTLTSFVHLAPLIPWPSALQHESLSRLSRAIKLSTRIFLDASLLFCTSMLISAIFILARSTMVSSATNWTTMTTKYISLWTTLPTMQLDIVANNCLRRIKLRSTIWLLIGALSIVVYSLSAAIQVPYFLKTLKLISDSDKEFQQTWEKLCLLQQKTSDLQTAMTVFSPAILIFSLTWILIDICRQFSCRNPTGWVLRDKTSSRSTPPWKFVYAMVGVLLMWSSLFVFCLYRIEANRAGGDLNKDEEWSFGQVFALMTWSPILVEWIYLWKYGPSEGLTGQIMRGYHAAPDEEASGETSEEMQELGRSNGTGYSRIEDPEMRATAPPGS